MFFTWFSAKSWEFNIALNKMCCFPFAVVKNIYEKCISGSGLPLSFGIFWGSSLELFYIYRVFFPIWNFQCFPKECFPSNFLRELRKYSAFSVWQGWEKKPNQWTTWRKIKNKISVLGLLWTWIGITSNLRAIYYVKNINIYQKGINPFHFFDVHQSCEAEMFTCVHVFWEEPFPPVIIKMCGGFFRLNYILGYVHHLSYHLFLLVSHCS